MVAAVSGAVALAAGATITSLNHQFIMIKTKKWLYLVNKGKSYCECYRAPHHLKDDLLNTQKQYDQAKRLLQGDPTPKVWKEDKGNF